MKHYRVKELPVKGVCKQQCCGVAHHERFPQDQLSGPCGQRGAVSHPEGPREAVEASLPAGPQHHIQQPEFLLPL